MPEAVDFVYRGDPMVKEYPHRGFGKMAEHPKKSPVTAEVHSREVEH
jgi:hypothetical protein